MKSKSTKHPAANETASPPTALSVEMWPIDRPKPYPKNARKLSDRAVDTVANSLKEFGWQQVIVVDVDDVIVAGHTRILAAKKLGMRFVPVHVGADLTPAQVKAYRLMDNRSSDETSWDIELVEAELIELNEQAYDMSMTGFTEAEVKALVAKANGGGLTEPDAAPERPEVPVSVAGDLWLLGEHRLLCGDSTAPDAVSRLLGPDKADLVFTDPPYNVDYDPEARDVHFSPDRKSKPLGKIKNDTKTPEQFRAFLDAVYSSIDSALKPGHAIYICHADTEGHHFRSAFIAQPWKLQSCIVWKKSQLVFGRADYHWIHEPILYGWKEGASHVWAGDRKQTSVWEFPTDHANKKQSDTAGYVHPTQKPVGLITRAVENSSAPHEIVLDLFGGSGSTLIACEKTGRRARLMELDPRYVDVIITRWEEFSGKKATLESGGTFEETKAARATQTKAPPQTAGKTKKAA